MPAEYAGHKLDLLSTLAELSALSGDKIQVDVHEIENFSEEATTAEQQYGIEPHPVSTINRGVRGTEEIFMGAAFTSGLDKVVIPFIDKGIPVEYELVRSICTVAGQKRKKLGVLKTDAQLFGGFSMQGPTEESQIITGAEEAVRGSRSRPDEADHAAVRRAAGRAAVVADAGGDGTFRRGGEGRPADGHFRGSVSCGSIRSATWWARRSRSGRRAA